MLYRNRNETCAHCENRDWLLARLYGYKEGAEGKRLQFIEKVIRQVTTHSAAKSCLHRPSVH